MSRMQSPSGIVAIVRLRNHVPTDDLLLAVTTGGIQNIEITMGTPDSLQTVARWRGMSAAQVGVGTVRTDDDARRAIASGAQFLVTPTTVPTVLAIARDAQIPVICGALTPTEIDHAWQLGAAAVKIFPVNSLGGADYVKSLQGPLPDISFVPTGDIDASTAKVYAALGCAGVGVGSPLIGEDIVSSGDWNGLEARAAEFADAWKDGASRPVGWMP